MVSGNWIPKGDDNAVKSSDFDTTDGIDPDYVFLNDAVGHIG